jgi:hypothetical protein
VLFRGVRQSEDAPEGAGDDVGPGPGAGKFQALFPLAAGEAGGHMADAVAQRLRSRSGRLAVQGKELETAAEIGGEGGGGEPGGVDVQLARRQQADPGSLLIADLGLDPGVLAVPAVQVGDLSPAMVGREGLVARLVLDLVGAGVRRSIPERRSDRQPELIDAVERQLLQVQESLYERGADRAPGGAR